MPEDISKGGADTKSVLVLPNKRTRCSGTKEVGVEGGSRCRGSRLRDGGVVGGAKRVLGGSDVGYVNTVARRHVGGPK